MGCGSSSTAVDQSPQKRKVTDQNPQLMVSSVEAFDTSTELDIGLLNDAVQAQNSGIDWEWKAAARKENTATEKKSESENKLTTPPADNERKQSNLQLQDFDDTELDVTNNEKVVTTDDSTAGLNHPP